MKRFLVILWVCVVLLAAMPAFAYGTSGITSSDFSARFDAAFIGFGKDQNIADADLFTTAEGYQVFSCKVNAATLTTTAHPDSDILKIVELSFPLSKLDAMMEETSAVISSFYADDVLNTRMIKAEGFLRRLSTAINNSPGLTAELDIEGYRLFLDFSGANVVYAFTLYE